MSTCVIQSPSDGEVWVRKEEEGCILYSRGRYAEGNHTAWDILQLLSTGETWSAISEQLAEKYGVSPDVVATGIDNLLKTFAESGWFEDLYCQFREELHNG